MEQFRYHFPQVDDMYYVYSHAELKLKQHVNLKELFGIGDNKAVKIESICWRAEEEVGLWMEVFFADYI